MMKPQDLHIKCLVTGGRFASRQGILIGYQGEFGLLLLEQGNTVCVSLSDLEAIT